MRKIKLFFLIFLISLGCYAQKDIYSNYVYPKTISSKYIFDVKENYDKVSSEKVAHQKKRDVNRYAEMVTYGKQAKFTSGYVYLDWAEMEEYLNKVLQQVLPDDLKGGEKLHIYPTRTAELNAFTIYDGSIFFNIGLLANVENEAALAIVIAHELGHFINKDVKNGFFERIKEYTKKNQNNLDLKIENATFSRNWENRADSIAYVLSENAGYDISYGMSNWLTFLEEETMKKDKKSNSKLSTSKKTKEEKDTTKSISDLLASHPETKARIDKLKIYLEMPERRKDTKKFIVDQKAFTELQKKAKLEMLHILLSENDFHECVKQSFIYYLLEPNEANYTYYLLESIRRLTYTDKSFAKKEFLAYDLKKNPKGKGILHSLRRLIPDQEKYKRIKDTVLLDSVKVPFENYTGAFKYFENVALSKNIHESLLTLALYYRQTDSLRTKYLNQYLRYSDTKYKDYASALSEKKLFGTLKNNSREIILLNDISFYEYHFYGIHNRLILSDQRSPEYISSIQNVVDKFAPEKELIKLDQLSYNDLKTKMDYKYIFNTFQFIKNKTNSSDTDVDDIEVVNLSNDPDKKTKSKEFNMFILNPDLWYTFKDNDLKSIALLSILAYDDKTKIWNLLQVINPCYWYYISYHLMAKIVSGSNRYLHSVYYDTYSVNPNRRTTYDHTTKYKMSKAHFLNSIYYALLSSKKDTK